MKVRVLTGWDTIMEPGIGHQVLMVLPQRADALFEDANGNPGPLNQITDFTLALNNELEPRTESQPLGFNGSVSIGNQFTDRQDTYRFYC